MPTPVQMYLTSDGSIFGTLEEATSYEEDNKALEELSKLLYNELSETLYYHDAEYLAKVLLNTYKLEKK
jgi:SHS2 domain-containing protein